VIQTMTEIKNIEERMFGSVHGDLKEHRHDQYDYWHPATRVHSESTRDQLPVGHVQKSLAEKLILDLVEVTPIQKMSIGACLEIGAVQSLMEGLQYHRCVGSCLISDWVKKNSTLFYAEWSPNHSDHTHRYLVSVVGEDVYVGYFPWDGRKPRLYGVHHKKQDVIKFLHRTHNATLQVPEITLLTELNIPNIQFGLVDPSPIGVHTTIGHKQGTFYTRSIYGEFVPLAQCVFTPSNPSGEGIVEQTIGTWSREVDSTGYNMGNPKHPYYMFQDAVGYVQLFEGKMFCYPDGSIRFLNPLEEQTLFRHYTDLQVVQGDLVAYEVQLPDPQEWDVKPFERCDLDRHEVRSDKMSVLRFEDKHFIVEDCTLTITHPEHGETKYEALKGEMLALLPGTSRPFQKNGGRD
jgi:hypothetical protein